MFPREGSILIRNARVSDTDGLVDVLIRSGRITEIGQDLEAPSGVEVLDAEGRLLLPGLVDCHLHLDKTLLGEPWIPLPEAHDLAGRMAASDYVLENVVTLSTAERGAALVRSAASLGTTALRSHVDITPRVGLANLHAILEVREQFRDLVDIQLVAFPQNGISRALGTEQLLAEALAAGADLVGGIDPGGFDGDVEEHLRVVFSLAAKYDVGIDIHLHDAGHLGAFEIERIAAWTLREGFQGRVAISHAFCLGELPPPEAARLIERLAEAQITIITNGSGHRHIPPLPALWAAGVRVAIGCDNVRDAWWPWGQGDMLERIFLVAYRSGLRTDPELHRVLKSATAEGADLLGVGPYGVEPGARADLILLDVGTAPEAVASHPVPSVVIKAGRVTAREGRLEHT